MSAQEDTNQLLDEIVRLLVLNARLQYETQREAIVAMAAVGLKPSRIADLLGTTPGTVNVTLSRSR